MKKNLFSVLVLVLIWIALFAGNWIKPTLNKFATPNEWRFPTENELIKNWKWTKQEINENLRVVGDFDGDRVNDEARLMIKKDHSSMGLLVVFSPNSPMEYWMLLAIEQPKSLKNYKISSKKSRVYQVTCKQIKKTCGGENQLFPIRALAIVVNDSDIFIWNRGQSEFIELLNFS